MRRFAIVVATLAAAVLGGLAVTGPAQAAPPREQYVVMSHGDVLHQWFWVDQLEGIIGCAKCVHWFDFRVGEVRVDETAIKGGILGGLGQLSEASVAGDPRVAERLRADALAQFTAAARELGRNELMAGPVGYYDPDKGVAVVAPTEWLASADQDIVDGIGLLQRSFTDPEPSPWRTAAMRQFDKAFKQIAIKKAFEG